MSTRKLRNSNTEETVNVADTDEVVQSINRFKFHLTTKPAPPTEVVSLANIPTSTLKHVYLTSTDIDHFRVFFDLWCDPEDLRYMQVPSGHQGRVHDMERIGNSLRRAADTILSDSRLKHG